MQKQQQISPNFLVVSVTLFVVVFGCIPTQTHAQTWKQATPTLPFNLGEVAAGIVDGGLFVVGQGNNKTCRLNLSPMASAWDCALAVRPHPGNHHAAVTPGDGTLWLVGGLNNGAEGKVNKYNIQTCI